MEKNNYRIIITVILVFTAVFLTSCLEEENSNFGTITGNMIVEKICVSQFCPKITDGELENIYSTRKIVIYDIENMDKVKETYAKKDGTYDLKLPQGEYYMDISNENFDTITEFPKYVEVKAKESTKVDIPIEINDN